MSDMVVFSPHKSLTLQSSVLSSHGNLIMGSNMKHDIRTVEYNMSLEEIAQHMGLTRERVRQIQNEALVKLRDGLAERGYTAKDLLTVLGMKADADTEEFICNLKRTKDH